MYVDFAKQSGSLLITVREDAEGPVEVVYDDNATVIVTLIGGEVADVQILLSREAAEKLAELLAKKGKS